MRIHYAIIATDYYTELCNRGVRGRRKAMAFVTYALDGELGNYHSERFYAEGWRVSPSTAHEWIKEFDAELDRFEAARSFKRSEHKRYVKNLTEQIEQTKPSKPSTSKARLQRECKEPTEQIEQSKSSKDLLINDDDIRDVEMKKKCFNDLYMIYRINTKYAGSKEDAYVEYMKLNHIEHKELVMAIVLYLHDREVEKKYNLANFLRNKIYLNYIDKRIRVKHEGEWIVGMYDSDREVLTDEFGNNYKLTPARVAEKFGNGEIEFIFGDVA